MKEQILTLLIAAICFTANAQNTDCNVNTVIDSSFEAGISSGAWTETSINFGTPLCTVATCGFGNGTGPHTGTWWAWFGGTTQNEEGSVSQSVVLPMNSTANLYFYLEIPVCVTTGFVDFMAVIIDNTDTLFMVTDTSPLCGVQSYALQTINLDAYADGSAHNILFYGHTFSSTNFFIDDVSVITCPITTSIQSVNTKPSISISPNPVKEKLNISFRNLPVTPTKIDITNLMGQSVYSHTLSLASMAQDDFYIDVAGLFEAGIYLVILTSGEKIFTQKLIVH
jgi:hypothetical protein